MKTFEMPAWAVEQVIAKRGRKHVFEDFDPRRTALLVVDLQNSFMMEGVAHNLVAAALQIVPNVNRLAASLRAAGGTVVWVQNTVTDESVASWTVYDDLSAPARREKRHASMREGARGHELWPELEVRGEDLVVRKTRFSAFIQGSSNLEASLRTRDIDTLLVTGAVTNVCCESTARDAMMLNFKTIMVSDANAAKRADEHAASLVSFYTTFGDVLSTDQVTASIERHASRSPIGQVAAE